MAKRKSPEARNPFEPLDGAVADAIDLHGFQAAEAEAAVRAFLRRAHQRTPGALVHVITGRGRGSTRGPVLKRTVKALLAAGHPAVSAWGEDLNGGGYLIRLT
jgi:DNA-nicking Smr family endonuclease